MGWPGLVEIGSSYVLSTCPSLTLSYADPPWRRYGDRRTGYRPPPDRAGAPNGRAVKMHSVDTRRAAPVHPIHGGRCIPPDPHYRTVPGKPPEDVNAIRSAAKFAVSRSSLRGVAREIRMSPTGLTKFLNGSSPYAPTYHLLRQWYATQRGTPSEVRVDAALDAMVVLLADLSGVERERVIEDILDTLRAAHGPDEPQWLLSLRQQLLYTRTPKPAARGPRGRRLKYER